MLNKILGANTRILGLKELHYFGGLVGIERLQNNVLKDDFVKLVSLIISRNERGLWRGIPTDDDIAIASQILNESQSGEITYAQLYTLAVSYLADREHKEIVCEQTPRNIFYGHDLLNIYPNSKIIHMVRDPRAVMASQKSKWRQKKLGARKIPLLEEIRVWINYHPITMSKLWLKASNAALKLSSSERVKLVKYEDFVESPEKIAKDICEFIGVEYEMEMLIISQMGSSYKKEKENHKGISKAGLNRWQQNLTNGEINICETLTASLLNHFTYSPTTSKNLSFSKYWYLITYPLHLIGVILANPKRLWIQIKAIHKSGV
jgi:hypothetical protein